MDPIEYFVKQLNQHSSTVFKEQNAPDGYFRGASKVSWCPLDTDTNPENASVYYPLSNDTVQQLWALVTGNNASTYDQFIKEPNNQVPSEKYVNGNLELFTKNYPYMNVCAVEEMS